ncbi:unnamed protein product [Pleuronectes platessa]|uniref:Uncharacterized protein n=1 Tax=Pleuronectes platessa TaxID=8262 RepID=A0A9N7TNQ7_PLEPL|nr:unnamed protein product [Pleuronectes platessa]
MMTTIRNNQCTAGFIFCCYGRNREVQVEISAAKTWKRKRRRRRRRTAANTLLWESQNIESWPESSAKPSPRLNLVLPHESMAILSVYRNWLQAESEENARL